MDGECSKPAEKDEIPMGMAGDGKTIYGRNKKEETEELMKAEYLDEILQKLIELIDEGVYIVDREGVGLYYNKAMADMEKVNIEDVLGKKFHESFPDFTLNESTMFEALKKARPTLRKQQTYRNLYGKEITTVNSTIPIVVDGKTVAAVEVAKDITNIRKMSDTLLELTEEKNETPKVKRQTASATIPLMIFMAKILNLKL